MNGQTRRTLSALAAVLLIPLPGLAVAAPSGATQAPRASVYAGTWSRTTGQDKDLTFKVNSRGRVTYLQVGWSASGAGCQIEATTTMKSLSVPISTHKKFQVRTQMGNTSLVVAGQMLSKAKSSGSLRVTVVDTTGYGCSGSARTSWTARKGAA